MAPKTRKTWNALRHENLQHNSTWSLDMVTFSLRPGKSNNGSCYMNLKLVWWPGSPFEQPKLPTRRLKCTSQSNIVELKNCTSTVPPGFCDHRIFQNLVNCAEFKKYEQNLAENDVFRLPTT